jgi:hypothetical protein
MAYVNHSRSVCSRRQGGEPRHVAEQEKEFPEGCSAWQFHQPAHYNRADPLYRDRPPKYQHRISTTPFNQLTNFDIKPDGYKLLEKLSRDAIMNHIH